jgi:hypothetical protein
MQARNRETADQVIPRVAEEDDPVIQTWPIGMAIGWASLTALLENALGFARGDEPHIDDHPDGNRVSSAFFTAGITLESYPDLAATLGRRMARIFDQW